MRLQVAGDASVELQLTATNAVKALALREDSLPLEGCQAGSSLTLFAEVLLFLPLLYFPCLQTAQRLPACKVGGCSVLTRKGLLLQVATEDEAALDGEAAAQGLALRLTPPGSSRSDDIVISPSEGPHTHTPAHSWLNC